MKTNKQILNEITPELNRFNQKFAEAMNEAETIEKLDKGKKWASLRRAAYDLKNELTKLTEASAYRWQNHKSEKNAK